MRGRTQNDVRRADEIGEKMGASGRDATYWVQRDLKRIFAK